MKKILKDEQSRKIFKVVVLSGVTLIVAYLLLTNLNTVGDKIKKFFGIISPFIWGGVLAFILLKTASSIEESLSDKMSKKMKRFISSLAAVLLFLLLLVILVSIIIPYLVSSIGQLSAAISSFSSNAASWLTMITKQFNISKNFSEILYEYSNEIITYLWAIAQSSIPNIIDITKSTVSALGNFFIGFIVALYILIDRDNLGRQFKDLMRAVLNNDSYQKGGHLLAVSTEKFSKFLSGKLLDSLIIGIICLVLMIILKLDFAVLISVIVGVTNIIPFFGPFIGAVPSALILLVVSPSQCLIFIIMIIVLQQIDGNIIGPRILGDSVGLSSLWIIFAIIVGGAYFGFFGMLLGVPVFSIIYFLVKEYVDQKNKELTK